MGATAPTTYLYDGANAVQETIGSATNPILTGLGIDERFARNDVNGRTDLLTDALNSTIALTDSTGTIKQQYSYDPYGNVTQSDTTTGFTNPYLYTGREADSAGLYYYRARYYSPPMGRFISEDPLGFGGGQNSFYASVGGDPLDKTDALGLSTMVVCRPINDWRVKWAGIVHCGVFVWHMDCDGNRVIDSQFSLAGNRTPFPQGSNAPTAVDDRNAFYQGDGGINGVSDWYIPPPAGMTSPQFDAAVTAAGNSYNSGQDYNAKNGPNSNTAANTIIQNAGGTLPDIPGAWQQYYHSGN